MENEKKIGLFLAGLILAGAFVTVFFPREGRRDQGALIRAGAGDDISGILMEETAEGLKEDYTVSGNLENSSFKDC